MRNHILVKNEEMESLHLVCSPFESTIENKSNSIHQSSKLLQGSSDLFSISNEHPSHRSYVDSGRYPVNHGILVSASIPTSTSFKLEQNNESFATDHHRIGTLERRAVSKIENTEPTTSFSRRLVSVTELHDRKTPLSALSDYDSHISSLEKTQIIDYASTNPLALEGDRINDVCSVRLQGSSLYEQRQDIGIMQYNNNIMATPTLTIAFSPFLTFSDDRSSTIDMLTNDTAVHSGRHEEEYNPLGGTVDQDSTEYPRDCVDSQGNLPSTPASRTKIKDQSLDIRQSSTTLTYADSLLLNAAQFRSTDPLATKKVNLQKESGKKRRAQNTGRPDRQPQKRYSVDLNDNEISGGDMFGSKRDGQVRLTTNVPREVEALDPTTSRRIRLFTSCSEAARSMNINRTRMSRKCRGGGGHIGDYFYKYAEMSDGNTNINPSTPPTHVEQNVAPAASALFQL